MKDFIFVFSIFLEMLFLSYCSITGYAYEGGESNSMYLFLILSTAAITTLYLYKDTNRLQRGMYFYICAFIIPLLLLFDKELEIMGNPVIATKTNGLVKITLGYIVPPTVTAVYVANKGITHFAKQIQVVMIIITCATLISIRSSVGGMGLGFGGANYQTLSYYAALAFCLNLSFILFGYKYKLYAMFKTKWYYYVSYLLLLLQLVGCLISGGRGGFVYLIACSAYMLIRTGKLSKVAIIGVFAIVTMFFVTTFMGDSKLISILDQQTQRTFSYISKSGIDMSETSNRDVVYSEASSYIVNHLPFGGGIYTSNYEFGGYPHNFFLEILMQGGYLYCGMWTIILLIVLRKFSYILKKGEYIVLPIIMYPFFSLLFSGSYLLTPLFWFCIVYCCTRFTIIKRNISIN